MDTKEASAEIARILNQLEHDQGQIVDRVNVREINSTTFSDQFPKTIRALEITLRPVPGIIR